MLNSRNDSVKLRKAQEDPGLVPIMVRFTHFRRYFEWFNNSIIEKDEEEKKRESSVTVE